MSIDQHVSVTVTVNNAGLSAVGFGTIAVITYKDMFDGMSAAYSSFAEAVADGYESDDVEVRVLKSIFAQSPHPPQVKLVKGTNAPTMRYELLVLDTVDTEYELKVKGEGFDDTTISVTPGMGDDEADIAGDLVTQLNLVDNKNYTAAVDGSDPSLIIVTGTAPGDWFSIEVLKTALIQSAKTHADAGIDDDLDAIVLEDSDFYYFYTPFGSEAELLTLGEWIEGTPFKVSITNTSDSLAENDALPATDIVAQITALTYKKTLPFYHRKPDQFIGARLSGKLAPLKPGSWSGAYKKLAGATADSFTTTQRNNLDAKKGSYYKTESGRNITWETKIGDTDYGFFDVTVGIDFIVDSLQKAIFGVLVSKLKTAYTDEDIAEIRSAAEGVIDLAKSDAYKIVAKGTPGDEDDPEPTVFWPRVADIDSSQRALRNLPDGRIAFRYQGAVHTVDVEVVVTF